MRGSRILDYVGNETTRRPCLVSPAAMSVVFTRRVSFLSAASRFRAADLDFWGSV